MKNVRKVFGQVLLRYTLKIVEEELLLIESIIVCCVEGILGTEFILVLNDILMNVPLADFFKELI
jgi:hypothetical protein